MTQYFTIDQAGSTTTVVCTGEPFTYDAAGHGCTASWTSTGADAEGAGLTVTYEGINGTIYGPSTALPVNAGDYQASASFGGDTNHTGSTDTEDFTIGKAGSTSTVVCPAGPYTYTGLAQEPCTASWSSTGADAEGAPLTVVYANNTNAGTATADASFAGDANHTGSSATQQTFTIDPATLVVTPTDESRTYGDPVGSYGFGVTGFVNGEDASTAAGYTAPVCSSAYSPTTPVSASPLTITCVAGSADNYVFDVTATASLTIDPATLVVTPTDESRTYGDPVGSYGFGVTGFVNGEDASTAAGYTAPVCSSAYSPTTPVSASPLTITCVAGSADNYVFDVTATASLTISPAGSTSTVVCPAGPYTYTGLAQEPCTASWSSTGADAEGAPLTVTYANNTNAGTASADAAFGGDANHTASVAVTQYFTIDQAGSTTTVVCTGEPFTYDAAGHGCTASWTSTGADAEGAGLTVTYEGINGTIYGPSTALPVNAGDYQASASFGGDTNHTGSTDTEDFTIGQATAVCTVTDYSGIYDAAAHGIGVDCTGVDAGGAALGSTVTNTDTFTDVPGGTASWSFEGGTNYEDEVGTGVVAITRPPRSAS